MTRADQLNFQATAVANYDRGYDSGHTSDDGSPMSPWNKTCVHQSSLGSTTSPDVGLIGSLVREEGHIYSLAASGALLYTGSDSKNIHVWKNMKLLSTIKSNSGLVKAVIISGDKIFTGHQDGKIRVWRSNSKDPKIHRRIDTFPTLFDIVKNSINSKNYVEVKRHHSALWLKHCDAISCLSIDEEQGLLYSGSWDRTFKVWKISTSKCLESVTAHNDAVNSIVSTSAGLVFTGSAEGTVKVWKREHQGKNINHKYLQTLLDQEHAVTALAASGGGTVVYGGSSDGVVNFWKREKELSHGGVLKGHKMAVLCISVAGDVVVSGSADKTVCVWRREGGDHRWLAVLGGHLGPVKCVAVAEAEVAEGRRYGGDGGGWVVYSGSLDRSVKVWRVSGKSPEVVRYRKVY